MSVAAQQKPRYTPGEYLALERKSEAKHQFVEGEIFDMGGGSPEHAAITFNLGAEVHGQVRGTSCQGFSNDLKVRTANRGLFSYPDLTVVCGTPLYHDDQRDVLLNPRVIFEVLSPSTEAFDRGRKRRLYQDIATLTDYIMISQDEPVVEHWIRQPNDDWLVATARGLEGRVVIESIECTLTLSAIYERVVFADQGL